MKKLGPLEWCWMGYSLVLLALHIAFGVTNNLALIAIVSVIALPAHLLSPYLHISMLFPDISGWPSTFLNWLWFSVVAGGTYYLLVRGAVLVLKKRPISERSASP